MVGVQESHAIGRGHLMGTQANLPQGTALAQDPGPRRGAGAQESPKQESPTDRGCIDPRVEIQFRKIKIRGTMGKMFNLFVVPFANL